MSAPHVGLIVVAAGSSTRMAGVDKVWADLGGMPVVQRALAALAPCASQSVLVVQQDVLARARSALHPIFPDLRFVTGGSDRQASVEHGLEALGPVEVVAVHDGARPLVSSSLLAEGLSCMREWDGAIPGIEVTDTLKQVDVGGEIAATVDRAYLRAVQTPQVFRAEILHRAHAQVTAEHARSTDDAALVERVGGHVCVFPGSRRNIKITTRLDLALARCLLGEDLA